MHIFPYRYAYIYTHNLKNKINLLKEISKDKDKEQGKRERKWGCLWADMPTWLKKPLGFLSRQVSKWPPSHLHYVWLHIHDSPQARILQLSLNLFRWSQISWLVCYMSTEFIILIFVYHTYLKFLLLVINAQSGISSERPTEHYYTDSEKEEKKI